MLAVKDEVSERIRGLSASLGYFLSAPRPNYAIHQTELYYQSATGNRDRIKLDINCLSRCHIYDTIVREAFNPFIPEEKLSVRILSEYELFGAKLKALLERNTPRDIFDAYTMERKGLYGDAESTSLIRKCIAYYLSLSRGVDIPQALEAIGRRPTQDFKKQLFPMLKTGYGFVDKDLMTSEAVKCVPVLLTLPKTNTCILKRLGKVIIGQTFCLRMNLQCGLRRILPPSSISLTARSYISSLHTLKRSCLTSALPSPAWRAIVRSIRLRWRMRRGRGGYDAGAVSYRHFRLWPADPLREHLLQRRRAVPADFRAEFIGRKL